jgi:hypothetical protein
MMLLNTSLLRERFTIVEKNKSKNTLVALGNRILLPLTSLNGEITERLVIRAHSMHTALYYASRIIQEFYKKGPVINRQMPFPWKDIWFDVTSDFERPHVPQTWVSVYHKGRILFQHGDHHPFLDVIEQCDIKNRAEYDRAIPIAQDIFKQAGHDVTINHDANIGLVIGAMEDRARCGLILRSPTKPGTFNFQIKQKITEDSNNQKLMPYHPLELAAFFLESIQLAITTGYTESQLDDNMITLSSPQALKAQSAYKRIGRLSKTIQTYENLYGMQYRPEKPDFVKLKDDAKAQKQDILS